MSTGVSLLRTAQSLLTGRTIATVHPDEGQQVCRNAPGHILWKINCVLTSCPGHTFTDPLAGFTTDQISRIISKMPTSVVRYGCGTVWQGRKGYFCDMSDTVCYGLIRNAAVKYGATRANACALRMRAVCYGARKG